MLIIYLSAAAVVAGAISYIIARPLGGIVRSAFGILLGSLVGIAVLVVAIVGLDPLDKPSLSALVLSCLAGGFIGSTYARYRRKNK